MDWKSYLRKTWNHRFLGSTLPLRAWRWRIAKSSRSFIKSQSCGLFSWRQTLSEDKKIRRWMETIVWWDLHENHWTNQEGTSEHRVMRREKWLIVVLYFIIVNHNILKKKANMGNHNIKLNFFFRYQKISYFCFIVF